MERLHTVKASSLEDIFATFQRKKTPHKQENRYWMEERRTSFVRRRRQTWRASSRIQSRDTVSETGDAIFLLKRTSLVTYLSHTYFLRDTTSTYTPGWTR